MSEQLKPCPFCGTAPRKRIQLDESLWSHDAVEWLTIVCDECDAESVSSEVHEDVIAAWNTRADDAALSRLRDTQRVLVEALEGLMEVERRNRLMPIGAAWDAARAALASVEEQPNAADAAMDALLDGAIASVEQPDSDHLTSAADEEVTARKVAPPEFQEVSWGLTSTMRPVKGLAVSDYAFRQWAKDVGISLIDRAAMQEPKP